LDNNIIQTLTRSAKNFVFLGEAGSGKTEVALNLALRMAAAGEKKVHFFDMDQTKPLFRARDAACVLERAGIVFHFQPQVLDAPTVVPGVLERLLDENAFVLMDVGGGSHGSHMIGQFSHILNRESTRVLYLVNPYRPWSGSAEAVTQTMAKVLGAARLKSTELIANPNLGPDTTADEVVAGETKLRRMFPDTDVGFLCALEALCPALEGRVPEPVFPIRLNTLPDWMA
jgi:RecA/RadA recombinase